MSGSVGTPKGNDPKPEFTRPERLDAIGEQPRTIIVTAGPDERAALARRFAVVAIPALEGRFAVSRQQDDVVAAGRVTGRIIQLCVVTGVAVTAAVDETVVLRFVRDGAARSEEIELAADALDIVGYDGTAVDLGEAAAETMALAINPFPRAPGADAVLRDAGVIGEDEVRPTGALAGLRAALDRRG